jgi:hypothetical protein
VGACDVGGRHRQHACLCYTDYWRKNCRQPS